MSVSIVMPVYNEEEVIEKVIRQCHSEIIAKLDGSECIVVNDASTDSTPKILERLAKEFPQLKVINLKKNSGHGKALRAGFNQVSNPVIFHMDSDNQFKIGDFWKLFPLIKNNDIVLGYRSPRRDPLHRKIIALMARMIIAVFFGISVKDINSPFKILKTSVVQEILGVISWDPFAISILIMTIAQNKGYRIVEVPVIHFARITGKSKLTSMQYLFKGCYFSLCDIFTLKSRFLRDNIATRKI